MADVESSDKEIRANSFAEDDGIDKSVKNTKSGREKSPQLDRSGGKSALGKRSKNENGSPESPEFDGNKSTGNPSGDEPKTMDEHEGKKDGVLRAVRSSSSPLCGKNSPGRLGIRCKSIQDRGQLELSDLSHVLFSTSKNLPAPPKHRDAARKGTQSGVQERAIQDETNDGKIQSDMGDLACLPIPPINTKKGQNAKHLDADQKVPKGSQRDMKELIEQPAKQHLVGHLPPLLFVLSTKQANDSEEIMRRSTMPGQRELEAIKRINEFQRNNMHRQEMKYSTPNKQRNTFSEGQRPSTAKSRESEKDLLSKFITYNDQLPPTPPAKLDRKYKPLPQHTPKTDRKLPSVTKPIMREHERDPKRRKSNDGVQMCSIIPSSLLASEQRTPEGQRQTGLPKSPRLSRGGPPLSEAPSSRSHRPRSILPLLFDIVRISVIMFSTASVIARSFIMFGGKIRPLLHYISNSPILWIVRWYMAVFHVVLIIVELNIGVPFLVPRGTLDNFFQKGFVVSFVGLLDLCMSANKSLADIVDELQSEGDEMSKRGVRTMCALAVLGMTSRGLVACGLIYVLFGFMGHNGESRRRLANSRRNVGLAKTITASI